MILGLLHISQAMPSTEMQSQASDTQKTKRSKNKSKEITQDKESNNEAKKSLCGGKHSLSACFVGLEVGVVLGKADIYGNIYHITSPTPNEINHKGGIGGGGVGNLILGYQWYFIEKMGIGLKAHLGYGGIIPYFTYAKAGNIANTSFSSSMEAYPFNAFNWGIQANYLLNFTKVFGLSLGAGFEMSYFENGEIYEWYKDREKKPDKPDKKELELQRAYPFDRFNVYGFIASVGLHFTTKNRHHQFGLSYTFKAYSDKILKSSEPIIRSIITKGYEEGDMTTIQTKTQTQTNFTATINPTNIVTLSYMYRF